MSLACKAAWGKRAARQAHLTLKSGCFTDEVPSGGEAQRGAAWWEQKWKDTQESQAVVGNTLTRAAENEQ